MKIERLMTREVVHVTADTPLKDVAALLSEKHISGMPVCDADGMVLGVVSEADILRTEQGIGPDVGGRLQWFFRRLDDDLDKIRARTAGAAMTAPALTVRPTDQTHVAARLMLLHRINRLPVVSDEKKLVGIVTRADLVRAFHRTDEEIADEIRDEILRDALWIEPGTVEIEVEDGIVKVGGPVATDLELETIVRCLRRVPGVVDVRSELHSRAGEKRRPVEADGHRRS
jgi:CBS-domain-containing membrane protein